MDPPGARVRKIISEPTGLVRNGIRVALGPLSSGQAEEGMEYRGDAGAENVNKHAVSVEEIANTSRSGHASPRELGSKKKNRTARQSAGVNGGDGIRCSSFEATECQRIRAHLVSCPQQSVRARLRRDSPALDATVLSQPPFSVSTLVRRPSLNSPKLRILDSCWPCACRNSPCPREAPCLARDPRRLLHHPLPVLLLLSSGRISPGNEISILRALFGIVRTHLISCVACRLLLPSARRGERAC